MKAKLLTAVSILLFNILAQGQQTTVNKLWQLNNSNPGSNEQIGSCLCPGGNFINFTNHKPSGNCDMSLNCITPTGSLAWQHGCNSSATADDYGSDVKTDNSGNIYICGAKHNGSNLDYYVAKYTAAGSLVWSQTYNGTGNNDDATSALALDASGNIYVTGTSYGPGMDFTDIVTIKYNNSGVSQWVKRYNFGTTPEVATGIKLDGLNNIIVCGSAANNMADADFIVLKYNPTNGNQLNIIRHSSPGNGFDAPSEMVIDANNNVYLVGTAQNGNNKNIKTLAINTSFTALWANYIDKSGNNDEGFGIELVSTSEIAITGYSQKTNNGTDLIAYKYNSANGNTIWSYKKSANIDNSIAKGRKIKKDQNGNLIIAGEIQAGAFRNFYVVSLNQSGNPVWEKQLNNGFGSNSARNLILNGNNVYINGISDNGISKQITSARLSTGLFNNPPVLVDGNLSHVDDELIIQFDAGATILNNFQTKDVQSGLLPEFVQPYVIKRLDSIYPIEGTWANARARKMFNEMTNADTISLSRVGIFVDHKNLWPTLVVTAPFPSEEAVADTISKIFPTVRYATKNNYAFLDSSNPNDPLFQNGDQSGYVNATYGINLPTAWNITTGSPNIKVGVFDTGIHFTHEDFGNGTFSGSKIVAGKDFSLNIDISTLTTPDNVGHGTAVAGIIGALSNNGKGVSGLAGGDVATSNTGCSLFAMKIGDDPQSLYPISVAANAIIEGAMFNPNTNFGFGLHCQNHSWSTSTNDPALRQAVLVCYNNSCAFIATSGNFPNPQCSAITCARYPSSYPGNQVIKVGANDSTGQHAAFSIQANSLDCIAPGHKRIYATTDHTSTNTYSFDGNGTSFAAPHVTGLAALMMSAHNTSMGAPANLAPEDVEKLILDNCTDVHTPGYDPETGHGRINAGLSVTKIQYPKYQIRHTLIQSANQTVGPPNTLINLLNPVNNIAAGTYFSTRYQMTWSYAEVFPLATQLMDWWNRPSSEVGYDGVNPVTGQTNVQYFQTASTSNAVFINATAFCYNITANILSQAMNAWIPTTPNGLRSAISVYAFDPTAIGINENSKSASEFNLFPNPANNLITISFDTNIGKNAVLEITDASGKIITKMPFKPEGSSSLTINMSHLADGVYFCKISSDSVNSVKKFVKVN